MSAWKTARPGTPPARRRRRPVPGRLRERRRAAARARALLDRPLTPYYLIVGITTLLLCLGLVMVLSTASVVDLSQGRVALPRLRGAARRRAASAFPSCGWRPAPHPGCSAPPPTRCSRSPIIGLGLTLIPGVGTSVGGATRWIALAGSLTFQPSELAKLALAVWGADLLARKEKLGMLTDWRHMLVPLLPGTGVLALLVMAGDDLGTTSILLIDLPRAAVVRRHARAGLHRHADPDGPGAACCSWWPRATGRSG